LTRFWLKKPRKSRQKIVKKNKRRKIVRKSK
jgi:hypothetical protein